MELDVQKSLHGYFLGSSKMNEGINAKKGVVAVISPNNIDVQAVVDELRAMQDDWENVLDGKRHITNVRMEAELEQDRFECYSHVLLVEDLSGDWKEESDATERADLICELLKMITRCNGKVCVGLIGDPSDYRKALQNLYPEYPELRWLSTTKRIFNINIKNGKWKIDDVANEVILKWLFANGQLGDENLLNYTDMCQISVRYFRRCLPHLDTLIRLTLLLVFGLLSVIFTGTTLIVIVRESAPERSIRRANTQLRDIIISQRQSNGAWLSGSGAWALLALQHDDDGWCFQDPTNQRSVDRLEISILADVLSRCRHTSEDPFIPKLAMYVNSMVATFLDPRQFHGHNLIQTLEELLLQKSLFITDIYGYCLGIIALSNAGVDVDIRHIYGLLSIQLENGAFGNSIDETAVAVLALSCVDDFDDGEPEVDIAIDQGVKYLRSLRQHDGSYGTVGTTALIMQAFNETGEQLSERERDITNTFLIRSLKDDISARNIHVAAQLLIYFTGETLVNGYKFRSNSVELPTNSSSPLPADGVDNHTNNQDS